MLNVAAIIAALALLVFLIATVLSILAMILRGVVVVCNRIAPDTKPVPIPSMGRAVAITVMSTFVNGVVLVDFGTVASFFPGTVIAPILALFAFAVGTFIIAKIVADIFPSGFGRALAIMFSATFCQVVTISICSSMIWTYINT